MCLFDISKFFGVKNMVERISTEKENQIQDTKNKKMKRGYLSFQIR